MLICCSDVSPVRDATEESRMTTAGDTSVLQKTQPLALARTQPRFSLFSFTERPVIASWQGFPRPRPENSREVLPTVPRRTLAHPVITPTVVYLFIIAVADRTAT